MTQNVIGIDLGGTHLRLATISPAGKILNLVKVVVGPKRNPQKIITLLTQAILSRDDFSRTGAVGMGVPGIVSSTKGCVYSSPHYPSWKNFLVSKRLQKKIRIPVVIDNDANMIASGEAWRGAGRDFGDFILFTLGTGIGGALVVAGRVYQGTHGFAGEFGHAVVDANGPHCACGSRGCLETFVSATALIRQVREKFSQKKLKVLGEDTSSWGKKLAVLARGGDKVAQKIFADMGYWLGIGLATVINVTGIQHVVIAGGLAGALDLMLPSARTEMRRRTYRQTAKGIVIRKAVLGDKAGLLGAAYLSLARSK